MRDQGEQRAEGQRDESVILFAHSFPKAGQSPLFRPLTFYFFLSQTFISPAFSTSCLHSLKQVMSFIL